MRCMSFLLGWTDNPSYNSVHWRWFHHNFNDISMCQATPAVAETSTVSKHTEHALSSSPRRMISTSTWASAIPLLTPLAKPCKASPYGMFPTKCEFQNCQRKQCWVVHGGTISLSSLQTVGEVGQQWYSLAKLSGFAELKNWKQQLQQKEASWPSGESHLIICTGSDSKKP